MALFLEKRHQALMAMLSLISEYEPNRRWEFVRERYRKMWWRSYTYTGSSVWEVGPDSDLYWAMRLGFADKMIESTTDGETSLAVVGPAEIAQVLTKMMDTMTAFALRQLKGQRETEQRLEQIRDRIQPSRKQILVFLQQRLGAVFKILPQTVVQTLIKAEEYYNTRVNDDDAKVWFHKGVEAAIYERLTEPLVKSLENTGCRKIRMCFAPPRGIEEKSTSTLKKLSLYEWADALGMLSEPTNKSFAALGTKEFRDFIAQRRGEPSLPDFRSLTEALRRIQDCRSGSAHFQAAEERAGHEKAELEEMRNLILGGNSVITQIFQTFSGK